MARGRRSGLGSAVALLSAWLVCAVSPGSADASRRGSAVAIDTDLVAEHSNCVKAKATVDVAARPDAVRDAILDFDARVAESWIVESVRVYEESIRPGRVHRRAKWTLEVVGITFVYHTIYDWDERSNVVRWRLDPDRRNDLPHAAGSYALSQRGSATSVVYTFEVGSRRRVSKWLRRRLTGRSVRELLTSIRARAEQT